MGDNIFRLKILGKDGKTRIQEIPLARPPAEILEPPMSRSCVAVRRRLEQYSDEGRLISEMDKDGVQHLEECDLCMEFLKGKNPRYSDD